MDLVKDGLANSLCHEVCDWDNIMSSAKGDKFVQIQVLLGHQLCPGDRRHPGEKLVAAAVALAVSLELEVADGGEEVRGMLIAEDQVRDGVVEVRLGKDVT